METQEEIIWETLAPLPPVRRSTRWIQIGTVRSDWFVIVQHQWGCPGCLLLFWVGKVDVFQPTEFLTWRGLLKAVDHRLALAGLRRLAVASGWPREGLLSALRVQVRRAKGTSKW